jgi:WD40 repeat protein
LQIYEIIVPLHCPHKIEEFSLLFAGNYENDKRGVAMLLEGFLEKPNVLPEKRLSFLSIGNDIRFMKLLGKGMLMIDCHNNAVVVENSQVKYRREKLHSEKIFAVAVGEGEIFATGGLDKVVKIWDCKINLLSTVELHRARINTLLLYDRNLIIFDQNAIISVHELEGSALKPSRRAVFKTTSPFLDTKYAKSKKKIIGITYA